MPKKLAAVATRGKNGHEPRTKVPARATVCTLLSTFSEIWWVSVSGLASKYVHFQSTKVSRILHRSLICVINLSMGFYRFQQKQFSLPNICSLFLQACIHPDTLCKFFFVRLNIFLIEFKNETKEFLPEEKATIQTDVIDIRGRCSTDESLTTLSPVLHAFLATIILSLLP